MKKKMIEQANRLIREVSSVIQGSTLGDGVAFLHHMIGALLISHKAIVDSMEENADFVQQMLLNMVMVHVLSPCKETKDVLGMMNAFADVYHDPVELRAELKRADEGEDRKDGEV